MIELKDTLPCWICKIETYDTVELQVSDGDQRSSIYICEDCFEDEEAVEDLMCELADPNIDTIS